MRIRKFFTGDLHIGHANILKFEPITRPYKTIEDHDRAIVKYWNHIVNPSDLVFHLGDVGMKATKNYIKDVYSQLNGTKVLIRGNHDKYTDRSLLYLGFVAILEEAEIRLGKDTFVKLCHCPYSSTEKGIIEKGRRPEKYNGWLLHGHVHSLFDIRPEYKMINVGWDIWKQPIIEDKILDIIRNNDLAANISQFLEKK